MEIKIRKYQEGDEPALGKILKDIYNQEFNENYWKWKYLENPGRDHYSYCALIDNRIVGFLGGIPYRIKYKDQILVGGQLTDLAIEKKYRGKRIFSLLRKTSLEELRAKTDFFYGFTNENSYLVYRKFSYVFHVPRLVKVLDIRPLLRKKSTPQIVQQTAGVIGNLGLGAVGAIVKKRRKTGIEISEAKSFDLSVNSLIEKTSSSDKIHHDLDHNYLNWRYCTHPVYRYTIFNDCEDDQLLGFAVVRNMEGNTHRGFILEFQVLQVREDAQHALLDRIEAHFKQLGVETVTCWVFPHSQYFKAFRNHLYLKRQGDLIVLVCLADKDNEQMRNGLTNPLNWNISCGDDESF